MHAENGEFCLGAGYSMSVNDIQVRRRSQRESPKSNLCVATHTGTVSSVTSEGELHLISSSARCWTTGRVGYLKVYWLSTITSTWMGTGNE